MEKLTVEIQQFPIYNLSIPVTSIPALIFNVAIQVLIGYGDDDEIYFTPEVVDYHDMVYMGLEVDCTFSGYKKFCQNFANMGINMAEIINKASEEVMAEYVTRDKFQWAIDQVATQRSLEIE